MRHTFCGPRPQEGDYIGIDLHKASSQVCILTEDGELVEHRIKTDRRDARALCEACRLGTYRQAHRTSDRQRDVRTHLAVRESLTHTRAKYISLIGALARREGCHIKAGRFARRVERAGLPAHTLLQTEPLLVMLKALNEQIKAADKRLEKIAGADEVVRRLCSVPGAGPVVATTFASTFNEASRFLGAKHVRSYLWLGPRRYNSGERQRRGRISKAGAVLQESLLSYKPPVSSSNIISESYS